VPQKVYGERRIEDRSLRGSRASDRMPEMVKKDDRGLSPLGSMQARM